MNGPAIGSSQEFAHKKVPLYYTVVCNSHLLFMQLYAYLHTLGLRLLGLQFAMEFTLPVVLQNVNKSELKIISV